MLEPGTWQPILDQDDQWHWKVAGISKISFDEQLFNLTGVLAPLAWERYATGYDFLISEKLGLEIDKVKKMNHWGKAYFQYMAEVDVRIEAEIERQKKDS